MLCLLGFSAAAQQLNVPDDVEVEAPPRFSVEFILFRYSDSVSSGSELFLPDAPPAEPEIPTYGDIPVVELDDQSGITTFGDGRSGGMETAPPQGPEAAEAEELFPASTSEGDEALDVELIELPSALDIEFRVLTEDERTMEEQYSTLSRLGAYEPVLWSGWTQTVREEMQTPSVALRRLGRVPLAFEGDLKLYLGRFLHLVVDLTLTDSQRIAEPAVPAARPSLFADVRSGEPVVQQISFRIREDRIVRNGDQRYFDHPKFGLLTKLTRVEDPPPETDESVLLPGS